MLAPANLPPSFAAWNALHKAPFGPVWWDSFLTNRYFGRYSHRFAPGRIVWSRRMRLPTAIMRGLGMFAFQANNPTRGFEYPWCFSAATIKPGMSVLEFGAGASGFQFALATYDVRVTSVDPLIEPSDSVQWGFTEHEYARLNRAFGNKVHFIREFLPNAKLSAKSFDRVFSVSVLEHLPIEAVLENVAEIHRLLKPGGLFVATADLFLDCAPFTGKHRNQYGSNVSIKALVETSGLILEFGDRSQLFGFEEFDADAIRQSKNKFLMANDVLTQCFILRRPNDV